MDEFAPGLVVIGSDGGGEAFALVRLADGSFRDVVVPFVGVAHDQVTALGTTFTAFLAAVARGPSFAGEGLGLPPGTER